MGFQKKDPTNHKKVKKASVIGAQDQTRVFGDLLRVLQTVNYSASPHAQFDEIDHDQTIPNCKKTLEVCIDKVCDAKTDFLNGGQEM